MGEVEKSVTHQIVAAPEASATVGRILFTLSGIIVVTVGKGSWVLPPQRALWIPGNTPYENFARKAGLLHVLALGGEAAGTPPDIHLLPVSPFFRALLIEAIRGGGLNMQAGRDTWLRALILSEFGAEVRPEERMTAPRDARLMTICEAILADPSDNRTIDQWARIVGMSRRALTRNFRLQTGLSLTVWRQQARLEQATARLKTGESVTRVAYEVGYESAASFSVIFRRHFGTSPSRFARSGLRG